MMRALLTATESEATEQALSRRLHDLRQIADAFRRSRTRPLQACQAILSRRTLDLRTQSFFAGLPADEKHYWIASLYALLMPKARRRRLAAYFTPPHLAHYAIETLVEAGIEPGRDRILDPASGGAAFLVPLAARISRNMRQRGAGAETILRTIESSISGVEIELDLAKLSRAVISDLLRTEIRAAGRTPDISIQHADTLKLPNPKNLYDAVIGNPPYGRVFRPTKATLKEFSSVVADGHVNLYALFLEQAMRWVRPGGVVCLIIPMSFLGGPYFASLRRRILETSHVLSIDPIDKRSDVFLDVLYDVCILALRKKAPLVRAAAPTSSLLMIGQPHRLLGTPDIPDQVTDRMWALPDKTGKQRFFQAGLQTLADYGYIAKTGYFVWNREQHRYRTGHKPRSTEVPLFWAHNVKANQPCEPLDDHDSGRIGFVKVSRENPAVIRSDAILLQRTSNRRQPRRLIAATISKARVPGKRGFISENHTILIIPDVSKKQRIPMKMLCRLLNTAAVDARFRRMSGSVSVSTKALRELPLPAVASVKAAFQAGLDYDGAAERAYADSLSAHQRKSSAMAASGR
jgi:adenine-specific DNA-methyltransferase